MTCMILREQNKPVGISCHAFSTNTLRSKAACLPALFVNHNDIWKHDSLTIAPHDPLVPCVISSTKKKKVSFRKSWLHYNSSRDPKVSYSYPNSVALPFSSILVISKCISIISEKSCLLLLLLQGKAHKATVSTTEVVWLDWTFSVSSYC